ncbi:MAG: glycosyltransferase family 4 protein [Syntrophales bacterium]|nr:glycosyltransferase family 4 protein [Syntrophales bacterium]
MNRILFLPLYDETWASSKYRVYKMAPYLRERGWECTVLKPPEKKLLPRFFYYSRLFAGCLSHQVVLIQKKLFRPVIFRLIRLLAKRLIFDFDDAIYCYERDKKQIDFILSQVDHVFVADAYLARYAEKFNDKVTIVPIALEKKDMLPHSPGDDKTVKIAWIGRPWNHRYLELLDGVFERLKSTGVNLSLYVVSGAPFRFPRSQFPVINIPWSEEAEEEILRKVDIGIVPLTDDDWSQGKCAYKVLLFMSYGVPVIASPVGVKAELIREGVNGLLASKENEWVEKILLLVHDHELRRKIGEAGYRTFATDYTFESVSARLAQILRLEIAENVRSG